MLYSIILNKITEISIQVDVPPALFLGINTTLICFVKYEIRYDLVSSGTKSRLAHSAAVQEVELLAETMVM